MKFVLSFLLFVAASVSAFASVQIIYNPVLTAPAGQAIDVSAILTGANSSTQVRLYYRVKGTDIYSSVEMGGSASSISGEIPASSVDTVGVEFYIQAMVNGQPVASSPAVNPSISPYYVTVRRDNSKPTLTILSPMEGDTVETANPVITVSYENGDLGIDPTSVSVEIDGNKVKDKDHIQAFNTLMSYVPSTDLSQGGHTVEVFVKNNSGTYGSIKWSFTVDSTGGGIKSVSAYHWDGHAGYETLYGLVTQQPNNQNTPLPYRPYGANRVDVEVNARGATDTYSLKVFATDEDRTDQQATDRFTGMLQNEEGLVVLGDYSPTFSELSLYQPYNVRGVTLDFRDGDLNDGHYRFMAVGGQTYRAVAQGASAFTNGTSSATFAQNLYGTRWELGDKYFVWGINAVTVNDDPGSLPNAVIGTINPQYAAVGSTDVKIQVPQIYLKLTGELGADYDFNGGTLLSPNLGNAYTAALDWNILPWGTHLTFDWKDLGGSFGFLPGGFTTMGNPGLIPDYRGYEAGFSQAALDGQLSFTLNANEWRNNLQNLTDESTNENNFISGNITIAPKGLPFLNLGYSLLLQNNNLSTVVMDSSGTTISPVDNNTSNLSAMLGYTHALTEKMALTVNGGIQEMMLTDNLAAGLRNTQDLDNVSYLFSLLLTAGPSTLSAAGSMGYSDQYGFDSADGADGLTLPSGSGTNSTVSVSWMLAWIPSVLNSRLGYDLVTTDLSTGAAGSTPAAVNDDTRSTYSIGGDYTYAKVHLFSVSFGYSIVNTNDTIASVGNPDAASMFLSDASYRWTF
jgi:hypothetical protein